MSTGSDEEFDGFMRGRWSNGKSVTAVPVGVGNEDLFAFPTGEGVSPAAWTAYDASGTVVAAGTVTQGAAPSTSKSSR